MTGGVPSLRSTGEKLPPLAMGIYYLWPAHGLKRLSSDLSGKKPVILSPWAGSKFGEAEAGM